MRNEMDIAYSGRERNEKYVRILGGNFKGIECFGNLGLNWMISLTVCHH
jgi:hypothetical protein